MNDKELEDWEKQVEETQKNNEIILLEFEQWLESKSLKPKTITKHVDNMRFFANQYLLRYEICPIEEGSSSIGIYLGDYFIRKTCWASKYTIQENIAGFKKFYTFLCEKGTISKSDFEYMLEIIKEEKADWIEEVETYYTEPSW